MARVWIKSDWEFPARIECLAKRYQPVYVVLQEPLERLPLRPRYQKNLEDNEVHPSTPDRSDSDIEICGASGVCAGRADNAGDRSGGKRTHP